MARKKSFAVIGANNFGLSVARTLEEKKQVVKIFDINEEKLNLYLSDLETIDGVIVDSTNKTALEKNGISQFDGVIVCFGSSMEVSIVTVLNLLDLDVENIVAKARDERHKRILIALGLDEQQIIIPDVITGQMVATKSLFDIESEVQSTDGEYVSTKIIVNEPSIIDKTIGEANLTPNKDFNIVQIRRNGKIVLPDEYTVLKENDQLVVFAKTTVINDLVLKLTDANDADE